MAVDNIYHIFMCVLFKQETESPEGGPRLPQVFFSIDHDAQSNILKVHINRAKNLMSSEQARKTF